MMQKLMIGIIVTLFVSLAALAGGAEVLTKDDVLSLGELIDTKGDFEDVNDEIISSAPYTVTTDPDVLKLYAENLIKLKITPTPDWIKRSADLLPENLRNKLPDVELEQKTQDAQQQADASAARAESAQGLATGAKYGIGGLFAVVIIIILVVMRRKHGSLKNALTPSRWAKANGELGLKAAKAVENKLAEIITLFNLKKLAVDENVKLANGMMNGFTFDQLYENAKRLKSVVYDGRAKIGMHDVDNIRKLNAQIISELNNVVKSFRWLEKADIDNVGLTAREASKLSKWAAEHDEFLQKHPNYAKVLSASYKDETVRKNKIAQIVHLVKQEYGPIVELLKMIKDEEPVLSSETAEIEKDTDITFKHDNYKGKPAIRISAKMEKIVIINFADVAARDSFMQRMTDTKVSGVSSMVRFLQSNFAERTYPAGTDHTAGATFMRWNGAAAYAGIEAHTTDKAGFNFKDRKWPRYKTADYCAKDIREKLARQLDLAKKVTEEAKVISMAEGRVVQEEQSKQKMDELIEKKIKTEAQEFEEVHKGKIPDKYIAVYKKVISRNNLSRLGERAKALGKTPWDELRDELIVECKKVDPSFDNDIIELMMKRAKEKLAGYLTAASGRKTLTPLLDELKSLNKDIKRQIIDEDVSLGGFINGFKYRKLRNRIKAIREAVLGFNASKDARETAFKKFNEEIVLPLTSHYNKRFGKDAAALVKKTGYLTALRDKAESITKDRDYLSKLK